MPRAEPTAAPAAPATTSAPPTSSAERKTLATKPSSAPPAELLAVLAIALLVFVAMLGKRDIVTSHEGRVAQTARQMAATGWPWDADSARVSAVSSALASDDVGVREQRITVNPWLVPVINGQIRLQKPPLPYWCTAAVYRLIGFGEGWTRLVPAMLGAIATLLVWDLARMVLGRRAAMPAAIVWVSTLFVVDEFRKAMADPYLAFFTLLAVWAWVRGGAAATLVFWLAMALGALAKAPVNLLTVLPAVVLAAVLLRRRSGAAWWWHVIGFALFALVAAPWAVYVVRRIPNAIELWRYESIGEFGEDERKGRPWWLYLASSFQLALPWTPVWIGGIALAVLGARTRKGKPRPAGTRARTMFLGPRARRRWFALGWFAIVLVVFSFATVKKNAYLLPVAPATALIVADMLALMLRSARRHRFGGIVGVLASMQAVIGVGLGLGVAVACWRQTELDRAAGVMLGIAAAIVAAAAIWTVVRSYPRAWLWLCGGSYALVLFAFIAIYMTDRENRRSSRPFARALGAYITGSGLPIVKTRLPEDVSFYLPLDLPAANASSDRAVVVLDDNHRDIERGRIRADESLFAPIVGEQRITSIDRIRLDADDGDGRWKAYLLTFDRRAAIGGSASGGSGAAFGTISHPPARRLAAPIRTARW